MTPYDGLMVGIIVAGMIWGALRGITWQVASLASLVLGYALAFPLSGQLAPYLPGQPIVARAVALLLTYIAISGGIFGVAWVIRTTLRTLRFEAYDRHLGMLLGGMEGAIVGSVVTVFVLSVAPSTRGPILGSPSGRLLGQVLNRVQPILPGEVRAELEPFWGQAPAVERVAADDRWQELKRPLTRPEPVAMPSVEPEPVEPEGGNQAATGRAVAEVIERGAERLSGDDEDSAARRVGRVVADTVEDEINRIGQPRQPGESRKQRIGRAVADLLGDEIDRMSGQRDERARNPRRR
jgi:uncharacterized membrane protein required for colicin V production